ncbi:MAG: O-antigen ligase family protein, partial [Treponema sp.]|nr:O-antigen ligase family protein [Treponema sp.]
MWLAYFTVFFAAMYFVREPHHAKPILYSLIFSSAIMGIIGLGQFMRWDFFNTEAAEWLVTAGTPAAGIRPVFTVSHGLLIHPNTFGKYCAMLSPILLLGALSYNGRRFVKQLLLAAGLLMLLNVFGSRTLGALVGLIIASGVLAITYVCGLVYNRKERGTAAAWRLFDKRLALMAAGVAGALVLSVLFITPINNRAALLFSRLGDAIRAETVTARNYFFESNTLTVYQGPYRLVSLTVHGLAAQGWLTVRDSSNQEVPYFYRQEVGTSARRYPVRYTFDVPGYRIITIDRYPRHFAYHHRSRMPFFLTLLDGRIHGMSLSGSLIDLAEEIPAWGFYGRETWGTLRGYIWSRSFPLMPSRTFIGSGPDTFAAAFPQQDMVGKQRFFRNPYIIIDLSHNWFIRTWITTGGISALALFALFG